MFLLLLVLDKAILGKARMYNMFISFGLLIYALHSLSTQSQNVSCKEAGTFLTGNNDSCVNSKGKDVVVIDVVVVVFVVVCVVAFIG